MTRIISSEVNVPFTRLVKLLRPLDMYSQLSIFGSWNYAVNKAAINALVRKLPDAPDDRDKGTVDVDANHKYHDDVAAIELDDVYPFVALRAVIEALYDENISSDDTKGLGDFDDTLEFITSHPPLGELFFAKVYTDKIRAGEDVAGQTKKQFAQSEAVRAAKAHAELTNKGQHAVSILNCLEDRDDAKLCPEWLFDTLENKMGDKLIQRYEATRIRKSKMRSVQAVAECEADLLIIGQALSELGREYTPTPQAEIDKQNAAYDAELGLTETPTQTTAPQAPQAPQAPDMATMMLTLMQMLTQMQQPQTQTPVQQIPMVKSHRDHFLDAAGKFH